jgi:hypothetical protein
MYVGSQHQFKQQLPIMHGKYPVATIGPRIILSTVPSLFLVKHARAGATPSPWPTETVFVITVDH